ncbi:MAG: SusC/RagA family TonB-linked outer membrane protein [Bacteroidetes bacterium]|nr:MAG: SusC/RagA family TonB-linked outer membrane protein [Bacteroidota bacterium]
MNLCVKTHNQGALRRYYMQRINALALKNKTLLMKFSLLAVIMTFSVILKASDGHGQDLDKMTTTIELKDVTLKQSLRVIESLTKLAFTYKTNDLAGYRISEYSRKDIAVSKLLNELLEHTDLKYEQVNDNIIIKKINDAQENTSATTSSQSVPDGGIRGRITNDKGEAVGQASITVVGGNKGSAANEQGDFSLTDLKAGKYKIQISAVGYLPETREIVVKDNESVELNIILHEDNSRLTDVVVTALGIKREQKTLGYASQQVTGAQLTQSNQPNLINALQGKVAGVTISSAGGGPGQGASIQIRGINSLNPDKDNQPLFVIDGLPVDNSTYTTGTDGNRGTQMANRISDINPEDIESINILRGGAATALYGLRGANGVVVITTKSGHAGKLAVHFTSSYSTDQIDKLPDLQLKYTMGFGGKVDDYDSTSFWPAWGPTVEEAKTVDPNHPDQLWNNWKRAYQTGHQLRNTISFSGGTDKSTISSSVSYFKQNGLIPFTWYQDVTARVNGQLKFSDQFKMGTSLYYANTDGNFYDADRFNEELIYWAPRWDVKDYVKEDGTQKTYGNGNPVYYAATNKYQSRVDHVIGNINFTYQPFKWLTATYLLGMDHYGDARTATAPGPKGVPDEILAEDNGLGFVHQYQINYRQLNSNFLLTLDHTWKGKFQTTFRVGNDVLDRSVNITSTEGNNLDVYNLFNLSNAKQISTSQNITNYRIIGLYGDLTLGYSNFLYLTLTGRNDWTSSLEKDNRSFFYPSASLSYIFTQHLNAPSWLNYGKLRASLAQIGKDALPYSTSVVYAPSFSQPINGVIGWSRYDAAGIASLKPEKTLTFEIGTDLSFFKDRLGMNFTWYKSNSKDLIIPVSVTPTTGFTSVTLNAGEIENKGVELTLRGAPIKEKSFSWDVLLNFSANKNKVVSIYPGLEEIVIGSQFGYSNSTVTMKYIPGESVGNIYGTPWTRYGDDKDPLRSDNSLPLLIGPNGFPVLTPYSNQKILGNSYPKWIASIGNTFNYKNWSLYFLFDTRQGLKKYDQFSNFLAAFGESQITLNRNDMVTFDGVLADGTKNTKEVWLGQGTGPDGHNYGSAGYYRAVYRGIAENFVEDASWVRLRTTTLSYRLPQSLLGRTFIKGVTLAFTGNNLLLFTQYKGFDPESSSTPASSNVNGFAGFSYPALRSYIFTLNASF